MPRHRAISDRGSLPTGATLGAALALCSLLQVAVAQESALRRQKVLGRVTTSDGKPWVGATVELIGSPYPDYWNAGAPDEVRALSDAAGSFVAEILPWRHYSAWAWSKADDGGFRVTRVAEDLVPMATAELVERPVPQARVRLRLEDQGDGAPPWGPLSFQLLCRPRNVVVRPVVFDERHEAQVPALPAPYTTLEAVTPQGVRVWSTAVPLVQVLRVSPQLRAPQRGAPLPSETDAKDPNVTVVRLPKPTGIHFTVRAKGTDQPIADATILVGAQSSMGSIGDVHDCRPLLRTDASGQAVVPMYLSWREDGSLAMPCPDVLVRAEGFGESLHRMMADLVDGRGYPTREAATAVSTLEPGGHAVQGQLVWAPGKPAPGVPVLVYESAQLNSTKPFVTRTDGDGRFRMPGLGQRIPYRVSALIPVTEPTEREECGLAFSPPCSPPGGVHDLGVLDLGALCRVQFQVVAKDGAPIDRARVYVGEPDAVRPNTPLTFLTDKLGRCTVRTRRGADLAVFAAHAEGFALLRLPVGKDSKSASARLSLAAAAWLAGRVVDTQGKPLEGARIFVSSTVKFDGPEWHHPFLRGVATATYALDYRSILTDRNGRFRAPFPELGVTLRINAWLQGEDGSAWEKQGDAIQQELTEAPVPDLELVLERKR